MGHTRRLDELTAADADRFGGKSAGLGELLRAGIPVPPGFALDAEATELDVALRAEIAERYAELVDGAGSPDPPVAVRSSAIGEDSAEATFAGQQDTYLWVRGLDEIGDAVTRCWASLHSAEAVAYRQRFHVERPAMGVTVQVMVDAAVSGVLFTCNPVTGDPSMIAINASWGLGVAVVGGEVTPDDYLVSKVTGEVVRATVNDKAVEYLPAERGTRRATVSDDRRSARCLDDDTIATLADLGKRIARHFGSPQDVEWAIDPAGKLFVLQSRPVTGLPERRTAPGPTSALGLVMQRFGAR